MNRDIELECFINRELGMIKAEIELLEIRNDVRKYISSNYYINNSDQNVMIDLCMELYGEIIIRYIK